MGGEGRHEGECQRRRQREMKRKEGKPEQEKGGGLSQGRTRGRREEINVCSYLTEESVRLVSVCLPVPRHRGFKGLADHVVVHPQVLVGTQY